MVDEYAVLFRNYCPSRIQLIQAILYLYSRASLLTFLSPLTLLDNVPPTDFQEDTNTYNGVTLRETFL
jgi:hypothetical protein